MIWTDVVSVMFVHLKRKRFNSIYFLINEKKSSATVDFNHFIRLEKVSKIPRKVGPTAGRNSHTHTHRRPSDIGIERTTIELVTNNGPLLLSIDLF